MLSHPTLSLISSIRERLKPEFLFSDLMALMAPDLMSIFACSVAVAVSTTGWSESAVVKQIIKSIYEQQVSFKQFSIVGLSEKLTEHIKWVDYTNIQTRSIYILHSCWLAFIEHSTDNCWNYIILSRTAFQATLVCLVGWTLLLQSKQCLFL